MLPGFRFLFAAVVLSMSVLIFGLGAAALLRSAHEKFASLPSRRAPAEPVFARPNDGPVPTLALLRFDPPAAADKPSENGPSTTEPATSAETEKLAALPEEPMQLEAPKPVEETRPVTETTAAAPAAAIENEAPVADREMKVAAVVETPEPSPAPPVTQPATEAPSLEGNIAATKIATLGGPAVTIEEKTAEKAAETKPDRSAAKKRAAERARERRRLAARRARLAAKQAAAVAAQQQANPFAQTTTARATQ